MRMTSAHNQREGGELERVPSLPGFQNYRMNMPLDMVHCNQRDAGRESNSLGVTEPDQQRSSQTRARRRRNRVQIFPSNRRAFQRFPHHRHNRAQVFPRRQFRHHSAIPAMHGELARDHRRQHPAFVFDNRRGSFVARAFNRKNAGHEV